jgi:hypothetical protein
MKTRNPVVVFILGLITCLLYHIYWLVATKGELSQHGAKIPTAWLILIPFVNIYWLWKWAEGVQQVSGFSPIGAFVLVLLTGPIGDAIVQRAFNKVAAAQPAPFSQS